MINVPPPSGQPLGRPPIPSPNEPGSLAEQFAAVGLALYLGSRRRTSAAAEWDDARRLVMPHARREADR